MKSSFFYTAIAIGIGMIALSPSAHAQCSSMGPRMIAWAALPSLTPATETVEAMAAKAGEARARGNVSIDGLWKTTFSAAGSIVDQAFEVFHSDGTEMMVDTAPPASGNVCVGVWVRTDGLTFKLTHPSWTFDASGVLNGIATIKMTLTLAPNSNKFTGTFTVDVANLSGVVQQHLAGNVAGERVFVE